MELEDRTAGALVCCTDRAIVGFDDRAHDRQAHPHTAWLGRVERFEHDILGALSQARARVANLDDQRRLVVERTARDLDGSRGSS